MRKKFKLFLIFSITAMFCITGCIEEILDVIDDNTSHEQESIVSLAGVSAFEAAGSVGGGDLTPGTFFPPTSEAFSELTRTEESLSYELYTTGLPPGAYTTWWVIYNNWEACEGVCDAPDNSNPEVQRSVFYSDGIVVGEDSIGTFHGFIKVGDISPIPDQHIAGPGLVNPTCAEVRIVVKYHGPASDNADELNLQTSSFRGLCEENANAVEIESAPHFRCADFQISVHAGISCEN